MLKNGVLKNRKDIPTSTYWYIKKTNPMPKQNKEMLIGTLNYELWDLLKLLFSMFTYSKLYHCPTVDLLFAVWLFIVPKANKLEARGLILIISKSNPYSNFNQYQSQRKTVFGGITKTLWCGYVVTYDFSLIVQLRALKLCYSILYVNI